MGPDPELPWDRLEQWRAPAFGLAGVLLAAQGVFIGLAVGELVSRFELAYDGYWFQLVGFWVWVWFFGVVGVAASLGVLGLYPTIRTRSPLLALASAAPALVGAVGGAVLASLPVIAVVGHGLGVFGDVVDNPMFHAYNASFGYYSWALTLGVLLAGAAALWTDTPSRLVGGSLLVAGLYPTVPFAINLRAIASLPGVPVAAIALVVAGYWLHGSPDPPDPGVGRHRGRRPGGE